MPNRRPIGTVSTLPHRHARHDAVAEVGREVALRRPRHDGQKPRRLHEKPTRRLSRQSSQATRKQIGVERRFSSHGLRRTANDLIRRVASGEVARAITGHVTERMTEHYSHVDVGEKKAAVEGMLRLVKGGKAEAANDTAKHAQGDSKHALN